ncbi:MAG: endolytic transglycosylase MltG [Firmicutes bacterium]|nr:endolytic transglycosylase MltG [Bacillota bacterium]
MNWTLRILLTILLLTAVSVIGYFYVDYSLTPRDIDRPTEVEISTGASVLAVGKTLEEKGLVKNEWIFAAYAYLKGEAKDMKAGVYEVPPGADANKILDIFTDGSQSVMRLVVPEGYTAEQIAAKLEEKGIDGEAFLKSVDRKSRNRFLLNRIPVEAERRHRLEGYLFPITYNLPKDTEPSQLVDKMLEQFRRHMEREGYLSDLKERNLTMDEWVTIASIIEKEAKVPEEYPRIAGVIYNRLQAGKKLQVDATVQYALEKRKQRLLYKHLEVKSPYNTYLYKGLPPGPISNPGKLALKAALHPEEHDYFFYVTRKDGTGRHYFARTEAGHNRNIKRSEQQAKKQQN